MLIITYIVPLFLVVNCLDKVNQAIDDYLVATSGRSKSSFGNRNLDLVTLWNDFKDIYSKKYSSSSEDDTRYNHFKGHVDKIISHNRAYLNGEHSFKLGINKYSDMHHEEFNKVMQGYKKSPTVGRARRMLHQMIPGKTEFYIDWREKGAVTDVKDQGQCGSCYAFSATGALEGMEAVKHGKLKNISEQQILDCSGAWGNMGCNGGLMDYSFQYVMDNEGIDNEVAYPYEAEDQNTCRFKRSNVIAMCDGFVDIPSKNEQALINACQHVGPISVAIDASSSEFMLYREGIYRDQECSIDELNHGVLVVGYGSEKIGDEIVPYWIVKNSWGKSWGDGGYIKMLGLNNTCGIASDASYPIVNK